MCSHVASVTHMHVTCTARSEALLVYVQPYVSALSQMQLLAALHCRVFTCAVQVKVSAGVPHHLIDILDPHEQFSAGHFHDVAHVAIEDILARGRVPIVVGGTGFYLRTLMYGKPGGGSATDAESSRAEQLLADSKAQKAEEKGVALADLSKDDAWDAGIAVLRDLGDADSADRCCSPALASLALVAAACETPVTCASGAMSACRLFVCPLRPAWQIHSRAGLLRSATTGTA